MALKRECDNPECGTFVDAATAEELNDLPAEWWVLEQAEGVGVMGSRYVVCSLPCVTAVAALELEPDGAGE